MQVQQVLGYNFEFEVVNNSVNVYREDNYLFHVDYPTTVSDVEFVFLQEMTRLVAIAFTTKNMNCSKRAMITLDCKRYLAHEDELYNQVVNKSVEPVMPIAIPELDAEEHPFARTFSVLHFHVNDNKWCEHAEVFNSKREAFDYVSRLYKEENNIRFGLVVSNKQLAWNDFMINAKNEAYHNYAQKRRKLITSFVEPNGVSAPVMTSLSYLVR